MGSRKRQRVAGMVADAPPGKGPASATRVRGGLEGLTDQQLDAKLNAILKGVQLRTGLSTEKAAQVALIEHGWEYWLRAVMRGVMRASVGKRATRELRSFERAITECGRLADPLKKLFADLDVNDADELSHIVAAYRQAQRADEADNLEVSCQTIEHHLKKVPEAAEGIVRRFGGTMGGDNGTA